MTCIRDSFKRVLNWESDTPDQSKDDEGDDQEGEADHYEDTRLKPSKSAVTHDDSQFESSRDILEIMSLQKVFSAKNVPTILTMIQFVIQSKANNTLV